MFKYVVKRVIAAIITLWALVTIVFFLVRLMPGDPFTGSINPKADPAQIKHLMRINADKRSSCQYEIVLRLR